MKNKIQSVAIGGFDGMHVAHQKLFEQLGVHGALVVIETGYANLTPKNQREQYTTYPIFYFDLQEIKHLNGQEFIDMLLRFFPDLKKIVVGYDFGFGANKANNANDLKKFFSGDVFIVEEFSLDGISVHSKEIRSFLQTGNLELANKLLGKKYQISGEIIVGQGLGKTDFVPTLNLSVKDFLIPCDGIYITQTILEKTTHNSISFIGHRKTTDGTFAIETHILNQTITCKYETASLIFIEKMRDNKKFDTFKELKEQILLDLEIANTYWKEHT